jgi:hypothetical protein
MNEATKEEKEAMELGEKFGYFIGRKAGIREALHLLLVAGVLNVTSTKYIGDGK